MNLLRFLIAGAIKSSSSSSPSSSMRDADEEEAEGMAAEAAAAAAARAAILKSVVFVVDVEEEEVETSSRSRLVPLRDVEPDDLPVEEEEEDEGFLGFLVEFDVEEEVEGAELAAKESKRSSSSPNPLAMSVRCNKSDVALYCLVRHWTQVLAWSF